MRDQQRFFGWTVVVAAFVVAVFGWGVGFYGPPIFLRTVQVTRGWSVALVSTAMTVHFLMGAIVVANLPGLHRRFGIPATTIAGAVALAVGASGWAVASQPWQLFAATIFSGAGWVVLAAAGINAMVSPWFNRRRPAALSMAYNGASVGGVIFSPLWVVLIEKAGFPMATLLIGVAMIAIIAVLSVRVLGWTPVAMGLRPDGDAAEPSATAIRRITRMPVTNLWRDRAFQTLALGMALGLVAQIGLIAHLFSLLVPALGSGGAGLAGGGSAIAAISGRTLVGWTIPAHADRRLVGAANYLVQAAGCGAFLLAGADNVPLLLAGVLLFGLGIGNTTSMPPLIAQSEFAPEDVGRVVAWVTAISQGFYAFAPAAFGLLRGIGSDPSSPFVFVAAALLQLAAAAAYASGHGAWRPRPALA